jgi:nucleoside-diphosphate-sugar epimerase
MLSMVALLQPRPDLATGLTFAVQAQTADIMMGTMLIFGRGYTASRLAARLRADGWTVIATRRAANTECLAFSDEAAVRAAIATATHILSSVPPFSEGGDPVLQIYGDAIASSVSPWVGYLSSTGVYGDTGGAWVDESASIGGGRRGARVDADVAWQSLGSRARIFRLPGIYGAGRSALDRVRAGKAHRIDSPDQIFSRIHVDDIVSAVMASFGAAAGVLNIADDLPCGQNSVIEYASAMLGMDPPPMQSFEDASLSPMARAFYAENRRVSNAKAKRLLGWKPQYPDYRAGLSACMATSNPMMTIPAPPVASHDQ